MKSRTALMMLVVALVFAGCATPGLLPALPDVAKNEGGVVVRSTLLDRTDHMTKHLDKEKNIVYFQNFGGGGVALGLLGPLGVAANMKMIENNTDNDVRTIRDKIEIDPVKTFLQAATTYGYPVGTGLKQSATKLSPYLYVVKVSEDNLQIAAALIVDVENSGKKWSGVYMYQIPQYYTINALGKMDKQASEALDEKLLYAFSQIIGVIRNERQDSVNSERQITFRSDFVFPRFGIELRGSLISESEERAWIRTVGAVYSLEKPSVKIMAVQ